MVLRSFFWTLFSFKNEMWAAILKTVSKNFETANLKKLNGFRFYTGKTYYKIKQDQKNEWKKCSLKLE